MENRPIGRQKKVVSGTGKLQKQGSGLGGGPVGNRGKNTGLNSAKKESGLFGKLFGGGNREGR